METRLRRDMAPPNLCGAVTGIGSLPLVDPVRAVDCVAAHCPDIPFWPQLPQRSEQEQIIGQALCALAPWIERRPTGFGYQIRPGQLDAAVERLHAGTAVLDNASAAGFAAFDEALTAGQFPQARAIKGQLEGPISVSCFLYAGDRPFVSDPALFSAICIHLAAVVKWQIARLGRMGHPVLFFVDEPALCLQPSSTRPDLLAGLWRVLQTVRGAGALAGLHCCAEMPFDPMCQVDPDILSFDACLGLEAFFDNANAAAFVRKGGRVAYGIIPTTSALHRDSASTLVARWLSTAARFGDVRQLARQAMVTSTCGLGLLEESAIGPSFTLARQVGTQLARLASD